jgi:hypothetical protein
MKQIEIHIPGKGSALAEIDDRNPRIADRIYQSLPIEAVAILWQKEVYFEISPKQADENLSPVAEKGDISYWSPGSAFCIFFGESQPYSAVNHIGKIASGLEIFSDVDDGDLIILNKK